jgi:hypothetical protein
MKPLLVGEQDVALRERPLRLTVRHAIGTRRVCADNAPTPQS